MGDVTLNVGIGLVTSMISAVLVWLWQRGRNARALYGKARFFGMRPGETCIVVMNHKWDRPRTAAHHDVQAMVEAVVLARELGCEVSMRVSGEFRDSNGPSVEFCIGGPENGSNVRTAGHLEQYLPGVDVRPFSDRDDSMAFVVGGETFPCERRRREHVLVAKFRPASATRPVFVICGQTAVTNHAAMVYLRRSHRELSRRLASMERFCLVLRVESISTYGAQEAVLARDVSATAFTPRPAVRPAPDV
ncbi:hypothetical protein ABZ464_21675 [Streptomyces sp. NPDC005820]|uniref:hypothetical protein n=1 Tax=Streptomyces sp. NPDC005820 TaxID=3157069 RepID=UPI0033C6A516